VDDLAASPTPLSVGAEEYLSWLAVEKGRSPNTLSAYRRDLLAYESSLRGAGRTPQEATPGDVEAHLARLRSAPRAAASVARAGSVVRGLHRFLVDEDLAESDPAADIGAVTIPRRLPKALTEDEVASLLAAAAGTAPRDRRDRALLEVLYGTGARVSEVVGLDLSDLAGADGLLRVYGKGGKERLVPLGRCAADALADWLGPQGRPQMVPRRWRRRGDAEAVFLNARGGRLTRQGAFAVIGRLGDRVGLGDRVSPHVLRHSCATHMLARGADIRVVQELLGHVSIGTTQLYTKVSPEHLRAAYEAAHPRAATPASAADARAPVRAPR